jgi:hypothetical protein
MLVTLLFACPLILAFSVQPARADVERRIGVETGDWVKYDIDVAFYSNDTDYQNLTSISGWDLNLQSMTITVLNVSGTTITIQRLLHFKNGTEEIPDPSTEDVNGSYCVFISASLSAGDTLFPNDSERINETISRSYLGELREVNHVNHTLTEHPSYPVSYYSSMQSYFDRATGVPVEHTINAEGVTGGGYVMNGSVLMMISDTNLWGSDSVPELSNVAYVFGLILMSISAIVIFRKKGMQHNYE